jgi:predicted TIM-barrel fold metal-dependent hydrolase
MNHHLLVRFVFLLCISAFALLLGGCCTTFQIPSPLDCIQAHDLTNDVAAFPELKNAPLIDIHSHTFNAHYLPLKNIAVARHYDVLWGLVWFIPDRSVEWLAQWIVDNSELADLDATPAPLAADISPQVKAAAIQFAVQNLRDQIAAGLANREAVGIRIKAASRVTERDRRRADRAVRGLFGELDPEDANFESQRRVDGDIPNWTPYRFIYFLQRNEHALRHDLTHTDFPQVDLFVHYMMDLAPAYGQEPDGKDLLHFSTQIDRVSRLDKRNDGRFISFVAFSPFRARTSHGIDFEAAWKPVQDALDRGAWGVKFYPPSGYRPAQNDIPMRNWFVPALRRQWAARYRGWSDEKLDEVMLKFFKRCEERQIPVFTHCGYGEFQAAGGYGPRHANPKYWRKVLQQCPNLRLCFGHAGGEDYWYADGKYQAWGEEVVKLCAQYPNVFCEVGASDGIVKLRNQRIFANRVLEITQKDPGFAQKILYGSDWFMPMKTEARSNYVNMYRQVFLCPQLEEHYKDFFCRNALRFLRMTEARIDADPSLSGEGKAKLKDLVTRSVK